MTQGLAQAQIVYNDISFCPRDNLAIAVCMRVNANSETLGAELTGQLAAIGRRCCP